MRTMIDRFWDKVVVIPFHPCWEWTAYLDRRGYGRFRVGVRILFAHRISWRLAHGPLAPDVCVLHKCDNPSCVNPRHLWLGSRADNVADMVEKGRHVATLGMRSGLAKVTDDQARAIRSLKGVEIQRITAERFGVSQPTVSEIQSRKRWSHVE